MKILKFAALCLLIPALTGCIRHRVILTSEPAQAEVYWNEQYRGRTPIEIPFTWHWWYTLQLKREGYETLDDKVRLKTRPWFIFPLDVIAEAIPLKFTDTRELHYILKPATEPIETTVPLE